MTFVAESQFLIFNNYAQTSRFIKEKEAILCLELEIALIFGTQSISRIVSEVNCLIRTHNSTFCLKNATMRTSTATSA